MFLPNDDDHGEKIDPEPCDVPGCNGQPRPTQTVCDACRRRFIKSPRFRARLLRLKIIPD